MADNLQPSGGQFRPIVPPQYVQPPAQQYRPALQNMHAAPGQMLHYPPPSSQPVSAPLYAQPQQSSQFPGSHFTGMGATMQPSYTYSTPYGHQINNMNAPAQYQMAPQTTWGSVEFQGTAQGLNAPNSTQDLSDWQEHTGADGRIYYFNKKTRQSSWDKPIELMTPLERADASTEWKEFTHSDGRKYYYHRVTKESRWTIPDELKTAREKAQSAASQLPVSESGAASVTPVGQSLPSAEMPPVDLNGSSTLTPPAVAPGSVDVEIKSVIPVDTNTAHSGTLSSGETASLSTSAVADVSIDAKSTSQNIGALDGASAEDMEEARKGMPVSGKINTTPMEEKAAEEETFAYPTKLEAKLAFKSMLESANVESDWTWDQAMRVIINDKRYGALKTLGEKKQAFNEYLGQKKKQDAEERRLKQKKAREDFKRMLEECQELTSSTRWSKAVTMFEDDERFTAIDRPRDREDLFESYLSELQKKERAKAAEDHKRNILEYRVFLESCDFIKTTTLWRKIQDRLEDDERCSKLEKIDRLEVFQEFMLDLEREEESQKRIHKEQVKRQERKNRDAFRKMLDEHVADGTLTAKTRWRDYCMQIKESKPYLAVAHNTSGSTPKDLFEDVAEELEKQYQEDRSRVKEAMKSGKVSLAISWTFDAFKSALLEDISLKGLSDINLKIIFEELVERLREKEEKEARRRQRLAEEFADLLYSAKEVTVSSTWDACKDLFEDSPEYRALGDEDIAREIFDELIKHLKEKQKEKERIKEEEKAKKEKEREEKEKKKERERKEKELRKEKEREREKERTNDRSWPEDVEIENLEEETHVSKDRKREKEREKKHRRHHHEEEDDVSSEKEERDDAKRSRRHTSDRKKSRKHAHASDSDNESRHKRHKKDRDAPRKVVHEELEDGEVGEDGEIY